MTLVREEMGMLCAACGLEIEGGEQGTTQERVCPHCEGEVWLDGRYRLMRVLGEGSVGMTYLAERLSDGEEVAIKELSMRRLKSFKKQELFEREAQVLKQLHHRGIPRYIEEFVWGVGKHQAFYLVEEYIRGETLAQEMAHRRYDEAEVVRFLSRALEVVSYLHERSPPVLHRDVKPENIMRREGSEEVVLVDFGVVRDGPVEAEQSATLVVGTPGYMAPEQWSGGAYPESDIYALGVVACVMVTRREASWLMGGEGGERRWAEAVRQEVSEATFALLYEMLREDYAHRPRVARQLQERMQQIAQALARGERPEVLRATRHEATPSPADTALIPLEPEVAIPAHYHKEESLFGLASALVVVGIMAIPCMTMVVGFLNAMVGVAFLCLGVILLVPFISTSKGEEERGEEAARPRKQLE